MERILVYVPKPGFHSYLFPIGLATLAGRLRQKGFNVSVLDTNIRYIPPSAATSIVRDKRPQMVVIPTSYKLHNNCPPITILQALRFAQLVKFVLPESLIVFVGPMNELIFEKLLDNKTVDVVCLGESEDILVDIACEIPLKI